MQARHGRWRGAGKPGVRIFSLMLVPHFEKYRFEKRQKQAMVAPMRRSGESPRHPTVSALECAEERRVKGERDPVAEGKRKYRHRALQKVLRIPRHFSPQGRLTRP